MMNKFFFLSICVNIITLPLMAMQPAPKLTLTDLNQDVLRIIARCLGHRSCASIRQTCRRLNDTFWNDSLPIEIQSTPDTVPIEIAMWEVLFELIQAAEYLIKKFNPTLDDTRADIPNGIKLRCYCYQLNTLPEQFAQTRFVRSLNLDSRGTPDDELAKLPRLLPCLGELKMRTDTISDLPQTFISWNSLKRLIIQGFYTLRNAPRNLEYLDAQDLFEYDRPVHLKDFLTFLQTLKILNLSSNEITEQELMELPDCVPSLEELVLSNNNLHELPIALAMGTNLKRLGLFGNNISEEFLKRMPALFQQLEVLDLSQNKLSRLPQEFNRFKKLKILHLEGFPQDWFKRDRCACADFSEGRCFARAHDIFNLYNGKAIEEKVVRVQANLILNISEIRVLLPNTRIIFSEVQ